CACGFHTGLLSECHGAHRGLHAFPTRRSSDLLGAGAMVLAQPLLPWGLAFAAGAMLYVISHEIIPETHRSGHQNRATLGLAIGLDRKSTRLNSSHVKISYAVFCLKKKKSTTGY